MIAAHEVMYGLHEPDFFGGGVGCTGGLVGLEQLSATASV